MYPLCSQCQPVQGELGCRCFATAFGYVRAKISPQGPAEILLVSQMILCTLSTPSICLGLCSIPISTSLCGLCGNNRVSRFTTDLRSTVVLGPDMGQMPADATTMRVCIAAYYYVCGPARVWPVHRVSGPVRPSTSWYVLRMISLFRSCDTAGELSRVDDGGV